MGLEDFPADFLRQLCVGGGNDNAVFFFADIHDPAKRILHAGDLGRVSDQILYFGPVVGKKTPLERDDAGRIPVGYAATGRTDEALRSLWRCTPFGTVPALAAENIATGTVGRPFDTTLFP